MFQRGRDDFDREYSYGTAFGMGANDGHMGGTHDDLDDDEEYGSDDDEVSIIVKGLDEL